MSQTSRLLALVVFASPLAFAKTVALWPLNGGEDGKIDVRCAINPANDLHLSSYAALLTDAPDWTLPQNPDGGMHVFPPYNDGCSVACKQYSQWAGDHGSNYTSSPSLFDALCVTNEVTIEGWAKITEWPTDGYPGGEIFEAYYGGNTLFFSARYDKATSELYFDVYYRGNAISGNPGGDYYFGRGKLTDLYGDTAWHHYAVVLSRENGKPYVSVYVDGELIDKKSTSNINTVDLSTENMLTLGGRNGTGTTNARVNKIQMDYWRISDTALEASEFLCAQGIGPKTYTDVGKTKRTVAYWPLRKLANGFIDHKNYAGGSDISSGFHGEFVSNSQIHEFELVRGDSAYKGQPPNPKIVLDPTTKWGAHCANGNQDSFGAFRYPTYCAIYKLNDTTRANPHAKSFALELYYRPLIREHLANMTAPDESQATLLTTMNEGTSENGWALLAVRDPVKGLNGGTSTWRLVFMDSESTAGDTSTYIAYGDFTGGAYVEGDGIWRHIAIVYTLTGGAGGFGQWELFVNGTSCGTVDNVRTPATKTNAEHYYMAGNGGLPGQMYGLFDSFIYSYDAITPNKFLCATEGAVKNDKLQAFLPLEVDTTNEIQPFGTAANDQTYFYFCSQGSHERNYNPVASDAGPTVTNPDPLYDQMGATGSALFRSGSDGQYATLSIRDERTTRLFSDGNTDMTFEGYYRRNAAIGTGWQIFFRAFGDYNGTTKVAMSSYRANNRIQMTDAAVGQEGDLWFNTAENPVSDMTDWTHCAWVRKSGVWSFYQNGALIGTAAKGTLKDINVRQIWLGGRVDVCTWCGEMAEIRVSAGALDPTEFLCAAPQTRNPPPAEADGTKAFWYLDNADGAAVLDNATLAGGYALTGAALGVAEAGRTRSGRIADDSALFDDTTRPNGGSVTPNASALSTVALGSRLEATAAFTVEGWAKPAAALEDEEFLCGTWDGEKGWAVSLVPGADGTASIALKAANALNAYADATLADAISARQMAGWFHFAVTYDPSVGKGTWTFFADGQELGSLENNLRPVFGSYGATGFALGGDSGFWGGFDLWRVSKGVRTAETMLWRKAAGGSLLMLR